MMFFKHSKTQSAINDFNAMADLLQIVLSKIDGQTDLTDARFETAGELRGYINMHIEKLKASNPDSLDSINIDFAPTGLYQELSIQNNWAEEYLNLSNVFDEIYERLTNK